MKELTHKDFFFCYTIELSDFLKENGISYIFKSRSIKDNAIFTLYQRTDGLKAKLDEFKNR